MFSRFISCSRTLKVESIVDSFQLSRVVLQCSYLKGLLFCAIVAVWLLMYMINATIKFLSSD